MGYGVVVARRVSDAIAELPFELAERVWDQIDWLLEDPIGRGRRAEFPRGTGQQFQFNAELGGTSYLFSLSYYFRDTPDENQVAITHLAITSGDGID